MLPLTSRFKLWKAGNWPAAWFRLTPGRSFWKRHLAVWYWKSKRSPRWRPNRNQPRPARNPSVWIDLVDGSTLLAEGYTARPGASRITLLGGEVIEMPPRDILTVRFRAGTESAAAEWMRIVGKKSQSDVLVTAKGDSIDGHNGAIHDVTEKQVQFDLNGDVVNVKRSKIYGLVFYHPQKSGHSEDQFTVTDASGSRWSARSMNYVGSGHGGIAEKLEWTTSTGLTVRRAAQGSDKHRLFSRQNRVPQRPEARVGRLYTLLWHGPGTAGPCRVVPPAPRPIHGIEALALAGSQFPKGLAIHSCTEMKYYLPGKFRKLEAVAGIDDDFRPRGNARLVLRGDDKTLLETTITGTDPPKAIEVDLTGVRRLVILVDYGDQLDIFSCLDLCNARIAK